MRYNFIREPEDGSWVTAREFLVRNRPLEEVKRELKERFMQAEVWFSDLDDCDAESPAKAIATNAIGTAHSNLRYLLWCLGTGFAIGFKGNRAESKRWEKYVENFLNNEKARKQVKELYIPETAKASLYKGVEEFYSILPAKKFYISRNIEEVISAYASVLGFEGFFSEVTDKGKIVERFLNTHPWIRNYGCSGDSVEDVSVVDVLRFYQFKKKIDTVITLYRAKRPKLRAKSSFDVHVGKDRSGLVEILKS